MHLIKNILLYFQDACVGLGVVNNLLQTNIILTATAIAIDRYITIIHCLKYSSWSQPKYISFIFFCVWITSTLLTFPLLLSTYAKVQYDEVSYMCIPNWKGKSSIVLVCFLTIYAIPVLIMTMCYMKIICVARSHARKISDMTKQINQNIYLRYTDKQVVFAPEMLATVSRTAMLGYPDANIFKPTNRNLSFIPRKISERSLTRFEREARAAVRLIGLVLAFIICWTPQVIVNIDKSYGNIVYIPHWLPVVATCMTMFQSVLNPYLYALLSKRFRFAMKKMIKKLISRALNEDNVRVLSQNRSRNEMRTYSVFPLKHIRLDHNSDITERNESVPGTSLGENGNSYYSKHHCRSKSNLQDPANKLYLSIPKRSFCNGTGTLKIKTIQTSSTNSKRISTQILHVQECNDSFCNVPGVIEGDTKIRICVDLTP